MQALPALATGYGRDISLATTLPTRRVLLRFSNIHGVRARYFGHVRARRVPRRGAHPGMRLLRRGSILGAWIAAATLALGARLVPT